MHVLVTGGTGFVGREVLRQLRAVGHDIRLLARDRAAARVVELLRSTGARPIAGDVLDSASLAPAVAGIDAVIHLVGIISEIGTNTFQNAHAQATLNVLRAAQTAGVKRYVQMSALGTRAGARSRYHQTKWAAEEAVRGSGLDWTILRPSLIYGREDQFVNLFARISRWSPVLPVMGSGRSQLQPVAVEVVAGAFAAALSQPASRGVTIDVCGPERLSFVEVLRQILMVLRRRRMLVHIPMPVARMQAAMLEALFPRWLGRAAPLNRDQLLMLQEDNVGDPQVMRELFGLQNPTFRAGISSSLAIE